MANISVTYSFSNGTTLEASEINQNFTDIINGTSDGTKDFTISALTAGGAAQFNGAATFASTATFNGAVTLGNATSDDITFIGYVASNIEPKTDATYTLGSSAQCWRSISLDNAVTDGGSVFFNSSSSTYLKSTADGTELDLGGFTYFDTNGAQIKTLASYNEAKSAAYPITDIDGVSSVYVTTSTTNRTITLPTAADNDGRIITIKKVDSASGKVTVDGENAETIDGEATIDLDYINESVTVQCDQTEWHITALKKTWKYLVNQSSSTYNNTSSTGQLSKTSIPQGVYRVTVGAQQWRQAPDEACYMQPQLNNADVALSGANDWYVGYNSTGSLSGEQINVLGITSTYILSFSSASNSFDLDIVAGTNSTIFYPWWSIEKINDETTIASEWD